MSSQTQYGHEGQHHGTGAPDCPRELHHHHDERCVSPLDTRRQVIRLAYYDACSPDRPEGSAIALETAIKAATRVQVTPDLLAAGGDADSAHSYGADYGAIITAAFRAAGFEVVE